MLYSAHSNARIVSLGSHSYASCVAFPSARVPSSNPWSSWGRLSHFHHSDYKFQEQSKCHMREGIPEELEVLNKRFCIYYKRSGGLKWNFQRLLDSNFGRDRGGAGP